MEKNRSRRHRLEIILALLCFGGLSAAGHYFFVSKKSEVEVSVSETVDSTSPVVTEIPVVQVPAVPLKFVAREPKVSRGDEQVEAPPAPVESVAVDKVPKAARDRKPVPDPVHEAVVSEIKAEDPSLVHEAVVSEIKVVRPPAPQIEPERLPAQSSAEMPLAPPQESEPMAMKSSVVTPMETPTVTPVMTPAVMPVASRKTLDPEFWVWAGVGENYQYYKQSVPSNAGSADFQNIKGPTLYLSVGSQGENFGAEFVHKESPGKMSAPPGTTITNGDYTWKILSAETLYKPDDSNWRWRLGFQSHSMPFMVYTPSANRLDIKTNLLILATVGFDRIYPISKKLRGEWQLRYQHPIAAGASSGDKFEVSPVVALDGSVGSIYQVTDQFRLGMFWYGQYHQYRFQYSGTSNFSGEQTLFYSNVELRAGFEF